MAVQITSNTSQFNAGLAKTNSHLNRFEKGIQSAGKYIAGFFAAGQVASFALEVSELAGKADGVRQAFEKLPQSIKLMEDLKHATMNAVSEFELMQRAVQANNFGISLAKLPAMLEFATTRAKQTGQSIDYLVDSLVTGLGRKSVLILDNLGISALAIREELEKVGDFSIAVGNIIERETARQGHAVETTATKVAQLGAEWINLKVAIGEAANSTGVLGTAIDTLTRSIQLLISKNLGFWEKLVGLINPSVAAANSIKDIAAQAAKISAEQQKSDWVKKMADDLLVFNKTIEEAITWEKEHRNLQSIIDELNKRLVKSTKELTKETKEQNNTYEDSIKLAHELGNAENKRLMQAAAMRDFIAGKQKRSDSVKSGVADGNSSSQDLAAGILGLRDGQQDKFYNDVKISIDLMKEQEAQVMANRNAWANLGATTSDAIAQSIAGGQTLLQSLSKITASIINQLEHITLARMVANSSKFGIGGILAAAAGFGIVKGIFGKLSKENSQSTYMSPVYSKNQSVTMVQRGTDLVGTLKQTNRLNGRTRG